MLDVLLKYYVLVCTPIAVKPLLSKQFIEYVESHRMVQHLIAFLSLLVLIYEMNKTIDFYDMIKYAVGLYGLFLLTTKMDIHIAVISLSLCLIFYLFNNQYIIKIEQLTNDKNILLDDKEKKIHQQNKIKLCAIIAIVSVMIIGTFLYSHKKKVQYGGGFDLDRFIFY